ncbi:hypothetical protein BASA81_002022 [Batrachochytrium salamandrivorans]|nr:hypothetical protein BASA81_002022 [Batrachochytrium salamandrivorans]
MQSETSSLSLDLVLETDYDGLLAFCEQRHCAETLKFWSAILSKYDEVPPPPPLPKKPLPVRASRVISRTLRRSMFPTQETPYFSIPFASSSLSSPSNGNSSSRNNSMLSLDTVGSSPRALPKYSALSVDALPFNPKQRQQQLDEEEEMGLVSMNPYFTHDGGLPQDFQRKLLPMLMTGSSIMKIELSMAKNMADKLGIGRGDVPWLELAQSIFIKYFDVNSPSQICVSPEITDEVEENLHAGNVTPYLFEAAQQVVYQEMKTSLFPAYLHKMWVSVQDLPSPPVELVSATQCSNSVGGVF